MDDECDESDMEEGESVGGTSEEEGGDSKEDDDSGSEDESDKEGGQFGDKVVVLDSFVDEVDFLAKFVMISLSLLPTV